MIIQKYLLPLPGVKDDYSQGQDYFLGYNDYSQGQGYFLGYHDYSQGQGYFLGSVDYSPPPIFNCLIHFTLDNGM